MRQVRHLLESKPLGVVSITPEAPVIDALRLMADHGVGAVLVMEEGRKLVGILSERDIIRALGELGAGALESAVSRSMTSKVVTCRPQTSVDELMEIMTMGRFRHVPVVENGRVTGIVSIGDVVKHRVAAIEAESQAMRQYIAMA